MAALLVLRFLAELGLLAALVWAGWQLPESTALSLVAVVLLPVGAALVWWRWVAPHASRRLKDPARAAVEVLLFFVAFVLLTRSDPQPETLAWGLGLLAAYLVSMPARHVEL
jgi:hypothetical protein